MGYLIKNIFALHKYSLPLALQTMDGMERMYLIYVCLSLILPYKAFRVLLLKNHSCSFCLEHSKLNIYFYPTGFT